MRWKVLVDGEWAGTFPNFGDAAMFIFIGDKECLFDCCQNTEIVKETRHER